MPVLRQLIFVKLAAPRKRGVKIGQQHLSRGHPLSESTASRLTDAGIDLASELIRDIFFRVHHPANIM